MTSMTRRVSSYGRVEMSLVWETYDSSYSSYYDESYSSLLCRESRHISLILDSSRRSLVIRQSRDESRMRDVWQSRGERSTTSMTRRVSWYDRYDETSLVIRQSRGETRHSRLATTLSWHATESRRWRQSRDTMETESWRVEYDETSLVIRQSRDIRISESWHTHMNESCHTYGWVVTHTHMIQLCHTYEQVLSRIWMRHVTRMNESCHTYE